jgi:hypothetical protein
MNQITSLISSSSSFLSLSSYLLSFIFSTPVRSTCHFRPSTSSELFLTFFLKGFRWGLH